MTGSEQKATASESNREWQPSGKWVEWVGAAGAGIGVTLVLVALITVGVWLIRHFANVWLGSAWRRGYWTGVVAVLIWRTVSGADKKKRDK
jgi:hypothetical protein